MLRSEAERANSYMERIQRIFDEHLDMFEKLIEDENEDSDEVLKSMVLAEYNFEGLASLYELSPGEFCEYVEKTMAMEDIDVWLDLIMKDPG